MHDKTTDIIIDYMCWLNHFKIFKVLFYIYVWVSVLCLCGIDFIKFTLSLIKPQYRSGKDDFLWFWIINVSRWQLELQNKSYKSINFFLKQVQKYRCCFKTCIELKQFQISVTVTCSLDETNRQRAKSLRKFNISYILYSSIKLLILFWVVRSLTDSGNNQMT